MTHKVIRLMKKVWKAHRWAAQERSGPEEEGMQAWCLSTWSQAHLQKEVRGGEGEKGRKREGRERGRGGVRERKKEVC